MIHEIDGDRFVISSGHVWLPGCYESRRAANYAFRFPDQVLVDLQDSVNPNGVITFKMLQGEARQIKVAAAPLSSPAR